MNPLAAISTGGGGLSLASGADSTDSYTTGAKTFNFSGSLPDNPNRPSLAGGQAVALSVGNGAVYVLGAGLALYLIYMAVKK